MRRDRRQRDQFRPMQYILTCDILLAFYCYALYPFMSHPRTFERIPQGAFRHCPWSVALFLCVARRKWARWEGRFPNSRRDEPDLVIFVGDTLDRSPILSSGFLSPPGSLRLSSIRPYQEYRGEIISRELRTSSKIDLLYGDRRPFPMRQRYTTIWWFRGWDTRHFLNCSPGSDRRTPQKVVAGESCVSET